MEKRPPTQPKILLPATQYGKIRFSDAVTNRTNPTLQRIPETQRTSNKQPDLRTVMKELAEINRMIVLGRLFALLQQLNVELADCHCMAEKATVLLRYVDIFE